MAKTKEHARPSSKKTKEHKLDFQNPSWPFLMRKTAKTTTLARFRQIKKSLVIKAASGNHTWGQQTKAVTSTGPTSKRNDKHDWTNLRNIKRRLRAQPPTVDEQDDEAPGGTRSRGGPPAAVSYTHTAQSLSLSPPSLARHL